MKIKKRRKRKLNQQNRKRKNRNEKKKQKERNFKIIKEEPQSENQLPCNLRSIFEKEKPKTATRKGKKIENKKTSRPNQKNRKKREKEITEKKDLKAKINSTQ